MRITVKQLIASKACADQVRVFCKLFGSSASVTLANCIKAGKAGLNFDWAARCLLPAPALDAYEKATAPARDAYEKATAPARDAYNRKAKATAWDAYDKAIATAFYLATKPKKGGEK